MPIQLTREEMRILARFIVEQLIVELTNEKTVDQISKIWGEYLDQWIGKNFRRLIVFLFIGLASAVAVKVQFWSWLAAGMNK